MATKSTSEEKLVTTALIAIEKSGWASLSLVSIARKAKVPLSELYELCPTKRALLSLIAKRIDVTFLSLPATQDIAVPVRDRVFEAILGWFECMEPLRPALSVIHEEGASDIGTIIDIIPVTMRSAHWIAECATIPSTGWQGFIAIRTIGLILAETMSVWLKDGKDLSKTMAHIDRRLRTLEEWSNNLNRIGSILNASSED